MPEPIQFLKEWQTLIGSILGGLFALGVALLVAHSARRREEIASGMLVVGNLVQIRSAYEALTELAKENKISEQEYALWFSDRLVTMRPLLSPLFDSSMTRIMPSDTYLAAHLTLFHRIYQEVQIMVERIARDFEYFNEHKKPLRSEDQLRADANLVTRHFEFAFRHATCAEKLISDLILSRVPTWNRLRRFAWPKLDEKECMKQLKDGG